MKLIILTRGAPGAGKTTFLISNELSEFVVSPDLIRAELGGVELNQNGDPQVGFFEERNVWLIVKKEIRNRMEAGKPVIVDATFQLPRDFGMPVGLAKQFGYKIIVLDFTSISKDTSIKQNSLRKGWKQVPDHVIKQAYERFNKHKLSAKVEKYTPSEFKKTQYFFDLARTI